MPGPNPPNKKKILGKVVQSIIPTLRKVRQEDHEFTASLGHIARLCLKTNKNTK
jgi:hypothetical protein